MFRRGAEMQFLAEQRLRLFRAGEDFDIGEVFVGASVDEILEGDNGADASDEDVLEVLLLPDE